MRVYIEPSVAKGKVLAPPSKSMAHRALICGALSRDAKINNLAYSKDILATLDCLKKMGAKVSQNEECVEIGQLDPFHIEEGTEMFCNESGSTLRFLIPLCMLSGKKVVLTGTERLFERPLTIYEDICKERNIFFERGKDRITVCGKLTSGQYYVPGNVSSQFITGLLFTLPLVTGDSVLAVTGKFESASYIDLTLSAMQSFGIDIKRVENTFYIKGNQQYKQMDYSVEGDCSNAAFLEGFNLLGGKVDVLGIDENTLQGDRVYKDIFNGLKNGEKQFELSDCPDLAPVMFAMAAYLGGATFSGTARLRIKESDRASAMAEELAKFGIETEVFEDFVIIHNGKLQKPEAILCGHNDHRIVMALSLLCSVTGGVIEEAQAVSKSFPDFFDVISRLGIQVEKQG